jgi:deoxycytidylate deaminase
MEEPLSADSNSELVFGLIGAMGTDLDAVSLILNEQLGAFGYISKQIRLSQTLRELQGEPWADIPPRNSPGYHKAAMDGGDTLCRRLQRRDAMAALATLAISATRSNQVSGDQKVAYVLTSFKRPEEIDLLRKIYGPSFFVISVYASRSSRVDRLSTVLHKAARRGRAGLFREEAEELITRDEKDDEESYGQDVRKTFPRADLFVNSTSIADLRSAINRFIELLFGHLWHTPTQDEMGMAAAYLARLRSASPARQVGAALMSRDGRLISTGMNDVPRAGGGQYWPGSPTDGRDFNYSQVDLSDEMRRDVLLDLLHRLKGDLVEGSDAYQVCIGAKDVVRLPKLREARLFDTIDFIRSVHAETSAILSASSYADFEGSTLYVTTFPCHECARHIVMVGITRVVYVEPYPKSLVAELYKDSVVVDSPSENSDRVSFRSCVGIAPRLYEALFDASRKTRKNNEGVLASWVPSRTIPHISESYSSDISRVLEAEEQAKFLQAVGLAGVNFNS